jgi:uncharacterized DUF497 family protein
MWQERWSGDWQSRGVQEEFIDVTLKRGYNLSVNYYEWDEDKRLDNLSKHGIDFLDADLVFEAFPKVTVNVSRLNDILKLVYVLRGRTVRCISMRVASQKERKLYHETKIS